MEDEVRYIFSNGDLFQKDLSIDFKKGKTHNYIPIKNIKELYLFNDCTITTKLLSTDFFPISVEKAINSLGT